LHPFAQAIASDAGDKGVAHLEIKKFRYSRSQRKGFERLVVEFTQKKSEGKGASAPAISVTPSPNGKESTIVVEPALLVGAIPEALINESYVRKSRFLGPISFSTDGPTSGFSMRAFLKSNVMVDAFWLDYPHRLVIDAFPADSARAAGRMPVEEGGSRRIASVSGNGSQIVCYPLSAAVSATVSFSPAGNGQTGYTPSLDFASLANHNPGGPEPVICFAANSQVVPNVAYRPKSLEIPSYVQWEGGLQQRVPASAPPAPQAAPAPAPTTNVAPQAPTNTTSSLGPPPPGGKPTGPGVVVTDVTPGRTPLGAPIPNPNSIQRLPTTTPPAKLPQLGDLPGANLPNKTAGTNPNALLPPVK
jgi:hypothetical protein